MSDWQYKRLGEICTFQRGHDLPKTKMIAGEFPVAGSNSIIGYHNEYTTNGPSLTIGRSGNIGTPFFYENKFWAHNTVLYVKEFIGSLPKYLYYLLKTIDFSQYNAGSAVPTLNRNHIHEHIVSVPPLPEQQAIAEVLSSIDDKIDLLHRNNKTLEEMAETLFRQWFVSEDEGSWTTVGEEFNIIMGQSPPGHTYNEDQHGIPFYQGRTDFNLRFPKRRVYCTEPTRLAKKFDTLLSVRAPVGDVNISTESCCIGRGLAAISHKNPEVHYSYTYMLFNFIKSSFDVHEQSGTVFGSISKNELHALKCPKLINPDLFTEKISLLQNKITENSIQIESLGELRDTLLPKLMSGQVRVNI